MCIRDSRCAVGSQQLLKLPLIFRHYLPCGKRSSDGLDILSGPGIFHFIQAIDPIFFRDLVTRQTVSISIAGVSGNDHTFQKHGIGGQKALHFGRNITVSVCIGTVSYTHLLLGLSFSFLGGAFVPQQLLSAPLQFIASFTPTYWFVRVSDQLGSGVIDPSQLLTGYVALTLFALAFALSTAVIARRRMQRDALS